MAQKVSKAILVSETNYEKLRQLGAVTDTFNSVITRLLELNEKVNRKKS